MPTPNSQTSPRPIHAEGPSAQALSAIAARVGPLAIGAGVVAPKRALPFSPDELKRLEQSWRFDGR
jgi:hypothetical protein